MMLISGLLVFIGVMPVLVLWCRWALKASQKRIDKAAAKGVWYDERQVAAHGKAYEFSTTVAVVYFLAAYICFNIWRLQECEPKIEPAIVMMGGVWLVLVSYHLCCLMTDSALPLGNYSFPAVLYIVVGALNMLTWAVSAVFLDIPLTGEGSDAWERLIMGVAFMAIGVIHIIARSRNKREAE